VPRILPLLPPVPVPLSRLLDITLALLLVPVPPPAPSAVKKGPRPPAHMPVKQYCQHGCRCHYHSHRHWAKTSTTGAKPIFHHCHCCKYLCHHPQSKNFNTAAGANNNLLWPWLHRRCQYLQHRRCLCLQHQHWCQKLQQYFQCQLPFLLSLSFPSWSIRLPL